jgi:hypothetical protein
VLNNKQSFSRNLNQIIKITHSVQHKNYLFNSNFIRNKRYFSTSVIQSTVNFDNLDFSNLNINISEFEIQNYTINNSNSKEFINFNDKDQLQFCITEFKNQFINNLSIQDISFKNANCYYIYDYFMYITNETFEPYFFEVLDFKKHLIFINDKKLTSYTLCIITNVSFLNVDLKKNSFQIKLFYINFILNDFPIEFGEIYFGIDKYMVILEYFKVYFNTNINQDVLISKIKNNIIFLNKYSFFNAIF